MWDKLSISKKIVQNMFNYIMESVRDTLSDSRYARKAYASLRKKFEPVWIFLNFFSDNIITEDETLPSLYVSYNKWESREWVFPNENQPKMLCSRQFHKEFLKPNIFWGWNMINRARKNWYSTKSSFQNEIAWNLVI